MYWDRKLNLLEIGRELGCASRTINIRMKELDIPLRKPGISGPEVIKEDLKMLYVDQDLSSRKIAKIYKCAYSYIDKKIRNYGFPVKTLAAAHITTKRLPFSNNPMEKAYLIGFRIGDLRVRKMYLNSETILIDCGSTHLEQISLINSLFSEYGRVWISQPSMSGRIQIECSVDFSFSFLLKKLSRFPSWTLRSKPLFLSVLAGFVDAEGCFFVTKDNKSARFSIGNYYSYILKQIQNKFTLMGYTTRLFLGVRKGYTGKDGYSHRQDYWILSVYRKHEVYRFTQSILPYLRHREKIEDAEKVLANIELRNKLYGQ